MNEKIMLVKAKGDRNWSIKTKPVTISPDFWIAHYLAKVFLETPSTEYIEFKPCCCTVERMIHLKDIEKYDIKREDVSQEMIL